MNTLQWHHFRNAWNKSSGHNLAFSKNPTYHFSCQYESKIQHMQIRYSRMVYLLICLWLWHVKLWWDSVSIISMFISFPYTTENIYIYIYSFIHRTVIFIYTKNEIIYIQILVEVVHFPLSTNTLGKDINAALLLQLWVNRTNWNL